MILTGVETRLASKGRHQRTMQVRQRSRGMRACQILGSGKTMQS